MAPSLLPAPTMLWISAQEGQGNGGWRRELSEGSNPRSR